MSSDLGTILFIIFRKLMTQYFLSAENGRGPLPRNYVNSCCWSCSPFGSFP